MVTQELWVSARSLSCNVGDLFFSDKTELLAAFSLEFKANVWQSYTAHVSKSHYIYREVWWWQHQAVRWLFIIREWFSCQRENTANLWLIKNLCHLNPAANLSEKNYNNWVQIKCECFSCLTCPRHVVTQCMCNINWSVQLSLVFVGSIWSVQQLVKRIKQRLKEWKYILSKYI